MRDPYIAILQLRDGLTPMVRDDIRRAVRSLSGVVEIEFEGTDPIVLVHFDHRRAGIAEIVRSVEQLGLAVSSVAQRAEEPGPFIEVLATREAAPSPTAD